VALQAVNTTSSCCDQQFSLGEKGLKRWPTQQESERSEQLLRSFPGGNKELAEFLQECRAGDYESDFETFALITRSIRSTTSATASIASSQL
jgi:hypothetical protein